MFLQNAVLRFGWLLILNSSLIGVLGPWASALTSQMEDIFPPNLICSHLSLELWMEFLIVLILTGWGRKDLTMASEVFWTGGAESLGGLCALHVYERCSIALGEAGVGVLMAGTTLQSLGDPAVTLNPSLCKMLLLGLNLPLWGYLKPCLLAEKASLFWSRKWLLDILIAAFGVRIDFF